MKFGTHQLSKGENSRFVFFKFIEIGCVENLSCHICLIQKQPSCKKRCSPLKGHGEKRCEIQGGGQEMAVMVG